MKRFIALSLPRWPIHARARRRTPSSPAPLPELFALTQSSTGGERLYTLSAGAQAAGLSRGQSLADAKGLEPGLKTAAADPDHDRRLLQGLARWLGRFSPWTAPDPGAPGEDGVLLDITGCARLFGGEDRLIAQLLQESRALGLEASAAAAPTIGLAWGMARFAAPRTRQGWLIAETIEPHLSALPIEALRIGNKAESLRRFGLKRIGQLTGLPRAQLTRRFGGELARRLDQARGAAPEVLNPLMPETRFRARLRFPEALLMMDGIKQAAREAVALVCEDMEKQGCGLKRARLILYRVDGETLGAEIGAAAPSRDPAHIARLLNEKLDRARLDIGFGIDMVEVCVTASERLGVRASGLLHRGAPEAEDIARLTDRIGARLGEDSVKRAGFSESRLPERAGYWRAGALTQTEADPPPALFARERPLLILPRPEMAEAVAEIPDGPPRSFVWRRLRHLTARAEGPERLAPEWWREPESGRSRDYFRVETIEGRRFWLFREGLFGRETRRPQWYVHGAS